MCRDLHEMTLKLARVICHADVGAKDEGRSHDKNYVVEVCRALDHEVAESPYLAR